MSEQINETYFAWLNKRIDKYEPPSREEVWNAATAEANKRIEALESEVAELKAELKSEKEHSNILLKNGGEFYRNELALKAHINTLREALEENHYCNSSDKAIALYNKALSATPAESLQAHYDEVAQFKVDAERYQFVRKLTPREFSEIYDINIKTGVHFDHLISQALKEVK